MIDRGPVTIGGHCGSCQHFTPPTEKRPGSYGECGLFETHQDKPRQGDEMALAQDEDGYHAWLVVRPEFGCTQWFPAPEEALVERGVKVDW